MKRLITIVAVLFVLTTTVRSQTFGVLVRGVYTDLKAGGHTFLPAQGLMVGAFTPLYANEHFVLRAEAGATFLRGRTIDTNEDRSTWSGTTVGAAILGRYYIKRKTSVSLGMEWSTMLNAPPEVAVGEYVTTPKRSDLALIIGAGRRLSDRVEIGARYGQGLSRAGVMGIHGLAHRRYFSVVASYLITSQRPGFAERRNWKNPNSSRY